MSALRGGAPNCSWTSAQFKSDGDDDASALASCPVDVAVIVERHRATAGRCPFRWWGCLEGSRFGDGDAGRVQLRVLGVGGGLEADLDSGEEESTLCGDKDVGGVHDFA